MASKPIHDQIEEITADAHMDMKEILDETREKTVAAVMASTTTTILAVVIGIILSVLLTRTITAPIAKMSEMVKKISMGDMTGVVEVDSKDELGELAETFNRMLSSIRVFLEEEQSKEG